MPELPEVETVVRGLAGRMPGRRITRLDLHREDLRSPIPLDPGFTPETLAKSLTGKRTPLTAALLDQQVVAGLGNIYVCEVLFEAGLSPRRLARTVTLERATRLVGAIRAVLKRAIAAGGSSLRNYV